MEITHSPIPKKSSSFSSSREEKLRDSDRNFSLGTLHFTPIAESCADVTEDSQESNSKPETPAAAGDNLEHSDLPSLSEDVDQFLSILRSLSDAPAAAPEIPDVAIDRFAALIEKEIAKYEGGSSATDRWSLVGHEEHPSFLESVNRASKLTAALTVFSAEPIYYQAMNNTGVVVHHAMAFLEDKFHALLVDDTKSAKPEATAAGGSSKTKRTPSFSLGNEPDRSDQQQNSGTPKADSSAAHDLSSLSPFLEQTARLQDIASSMIAAGYEAECCQVFSIARLNTMEANLADLGFEKISIDDVQRMAWESLEAEIVTWTKSFRHAITVTFPRERDLCDAVFDSGADTPLAADIFRNLARGVLIKLLTFADAVAMTKRSAEKLFKVLDMYEALRDMTPKLDEMFPTSDDSADDSAAEFNADLKAELSSVRSRLGEAVVSIFCELESSIKSDTSKTPVPGGAVHPLTRYVMNYLKYACEYKNTLEQVFKEHQKLDRATSSSYGDDNAARSALSNSRKANPFSAQVVEVMDLLHANVEAKAKLYKDLALSNIFMMNNGRYIVQKIKGSAEIRQLLGDAWWRKKSSDLRQYHKNYQRETWSKVLGCFKDDGLHVKGAVVKPVLKERFKSFNAMFEEIHKTQSGWVVSDDQLQSELRVSVSAVVVPAYRSFLGRFSQYLDHGRQTEKYVKFGAEDLESYIDDLFDGNPAATMKRKP